MAAVCAAAPQATAADAFAWPALTSQTKPWAFWWWMGSAVDKTNLSHELQRYHDAGMGGVHIIPIYGAYGFESNYIDYLSPKWMEMMSYTVTEAKRLGMGIDMTTGTGWCFGGPTVSDQDANASVITDTYTVTSDQPLTNKFDPVSTQTLMAFSSTGEKMDLTPLISTSGEVVFAPTNGTWKVYAISQQPSGQKVKRSAPGGEGWMLNLFYAEAMTNYLKWFSAAFDGYTNAIPRSQFQDSYEYRCDWSPDFFAEFQKRRGYRLQEELPALFGTEKDDLAARVKCDYRETISDMMVENTLPLWVKWSHDHGFITRDQAHGSPGNLLDLYAVADIPETEMFHSDRSIFISKFASSAAHVAGHPLTSAETGTWLTEHFLTTLADLKYLEDDMFLSGINHIFYHGVCYSPDEAMWPGWTFYASTDMNPRNSIWHDVGTLNAYAARCQAVLQSGKPDNDVLLYWPIYDHWHNPNGMVQLIRIHGPDWFDDQNISKTARELWKVGYGFDYVSDRELAGASVVNGKVQVPGGSYQVIVVPECTYMPLATLKQLRALAEAGAKVIFQNQFPSDVPGLGDLEGQRAEFKAQIARLSQPDTAWAGMGGGKIGKGVVLRGNLELGLSATDVRREVLADDGLSFIRRSFDGGSHYFIANRGDSNFDGWITLARPAKSVVVLDPMTGNEGVAAIQPMGDQVRVHVQLAAGESIILRAFADKNVKGDAWNCWQAKGQSMEVTGDWNVKFVQGGPVLPAAYTTSKPGSWTGAGDTNAQNFAGSARYSITFDAPADAKGSYYLDLGKVCQSARVRLNGRDLGTFIIPPFRVAVSDLKLKGNLLEVEVTSVAANRIRDLDLRGVPWKYFRDINVVNLAYHPFDASDWALTDCGLLGPVTLTTISGE